MEESTDKVLGYDVGRESQISAFAQAAIGPKRTFVGDIVPAPIMEILARPYRPRVTSFTSCHLPSMACIHGVVREQ